MSMAKRHRFDFTILDFHLPGMTGLELFQGLATIRPLPGILMSGLATPEEAAAARHAGFFAFLRKPLELERLRQSVQQLIQTHFGGPVVPRPARPDHRYLRGRFEEGLGQCGGDAAQQIERNEAHMTHGILDIVAEDPQVQHIADQVENENDGRCDQDRLEPGVLCEHVLPHVVRVAARRGPLASHRLFEL